MSKITNIHFVGIKGVGMTALAILLKEAGFGVTGSDTTEQFITDSSLGKAGIVFFRGFSSDNINNSQLVITTGAHGGFENIEVVSAKEKGIRVVSFAEAVGMLMSGSLLGTSLKGISVAGTHGKTTTTAMIATVLSDNDLDPSYLIGTSEISTLANAGHFGKGEYFVVEADEYATEPTYDRRAKFLWHTPNIVVITNIEHDHPDIYPTLDSFADSFRKLLGNLSNESMVIVNGDDPEVQKLLHEYKGKRITYGNSEGNDVVIKDIHTGLESTTFRVKAYGKDLGEFLLHVPGEHNCLNALASVIVSMEVGVEVSGIQRAISKFKGSKRRLEYITTLSSGALVYDDYAHHPTEIIKTLKALREMYPTKKIISIFQPHTYSRTKALFSEFASAFYEADSVIFLDIFPSAREKIDISTSSSMLALEAKKQHDDVLFLPKITDVVKYFDENPPTENTLIVTIGAGDVYKITEELQVISPKL